MERWINKCLLKHKCIGKCNNLFNKKAKLIYHLYQKLIFYLIRKCQYYTSYYIFVYRYQDLWISEPNNEYIKSEDNHRDKEVSNI